MRIRDNAYASYATSDPERNKHETVVTRTIDAQDPPPPPPGQQPAPPPPPPPPCTKEVHFDLSQFKTSGCFTQTGSNPDTYTTTDAVKLNGISFADFGQTFTITASYGGLAGHFTAPNSAIQLDSFTAFSGDIDWALPTSGADGEKEVKPHRSSQWARRSWASTCVARSPCASAATAASTTRRSRSTSSCRAASAPARTPTTAA